MTVLGWVEAIAKLVGFFAALAAVSVGLVSLRARWRHWQMQQWFRSVPRRAADACVEGELVRVTGIVMASEETLTAPSDGASCVYYVASFSMSPWLGGALGGGHRTHGSRFWVDADGQWVCIDSAKAALHLGPRSIRGAEPGAVTAAIRTELALVASDFAEPIAESRARYSEARLAVGERVAVVGRAAWMETKSAGSKMSSAYRGGEVPLRVLCIVAAPGEVVQITDDARACG